MVILISNRGYIKRIPVTAYRTAGARGERVLLGSLEGG